MKFLSLAALCVVVTTLVAQVSKSSAKTVSIEGAYLARGESGEIQYRNGTDVYNNSNMQIRPVSSTETWPTWHWVYLYFTSLEELTAALDKLPLPVAREAKISQTHDGLMFILIYRASLKP